jgi:Tol biopolymer transport system component
LILARGARLGPYEIRSLLGAGGMGEVYEAHDPRLDRTVAIKILTSSLSSSPDIRARFEREARTISRLSHPRICAVYDVGHDASLDFLVMELLQGETLAQRLVRGPLPIEQTLRYGVEIAEALAQAHRQGVVHRDLKPGNVMLTASGVKLLDFGLAKAVAPLLSGGPASAAPTAAAPVPLTEAGVIVGTLQYMAPEQLEGRPLDMRTDIFALGAVLYEMATGKRAFVGTSPVAIASAVLHDDPAPISVVRPGSPVALDRLVRTCLAKDPEQRWQTAHDVGLQLASMGESGPSVVAAGPLPPGARPRRRWTLAPWATAVAAILVALAAWLRPLPAPRAAATTPIRFEIPPPAGGAFFDTYPVETITLAVSPDGAQVAFVASQAGSAPRIWVRPFSFLEPRPVPGTDGATSLFWAPDGRSIAFFVADKLKRVDLTGGAAVVICDVPQSIGLFGTWGADGDILFAAVSGQAIFRVSTTGGTPVAEIKPDPTRGEARTSWPWFLPDGRRFLYLDVHQDRTGWIMLGEHGKAGRPILQANSNAQYVEPGLLVYAREGTLVGQRFDVANGTVTREQISIAEPVRYFVTTAMATFSTSRNGVLVYQSHTDQSRLGWFDRSGADVGATGTHGRVQRVRLSPNARMVLFDRAQPRTGTYDLWSLNLADGAERRLTSDAGNENTGPWLGDTVFFSQQAGATPPHLFRKDLATDKEEELLQTSAFQEPHDVSPDEKTLVFTERNARGDDDIWTLSLTGARVPLPFAETPFEEWDPRFSKDGHWIAFTSNESGRLEVYVAPYPATGGKRLVSAGGASMPRWSRDGRELFYVSSDDHMMAVQVRLTPSLDLGPAVSLFLLKEGARWVDYDVAPDGKRFLAIAPESSGNSQPLTAISNWIAEVAR